MRRDGSVQSDAETEHLGKTPKESRSLLGVSPWPVSWRRREPPWKETLDWPRLTTSQNLSTYVVLEGVGHGRRTP